MSLKDVKMNFLVDIATDLFICRSIQDVTIKDIAVSAQVGEATIYRYFGKKHKSSSIIQNSTSLLMSLIHSLVARILQAVMSSTHMNRSLVNMRRFI